MGLIEELIRSLAHLSGLGVEVADLVKITEDVLHDIQAVESGADVKYAIGVLALAGQEIQYGIWAHRVK